jgi:hypothetical protein
VLSLEAQLATLLPSTTPCPDSNQPPLVFANQAKNIWLVWGRLSTGYENWYPAGRTIFGGAMDEAAGVHCPCMGSYWVAVRREGPASDQTTQNWGSGFWLDLATVGSFCRGDARAWLD